MRTGHFRLESGHHTDRWLDLTQLFVHPAKLRPFVAGLASRLSPHAPEIVCGPMTGGAFLAEMIAIELGPASAPRSGCRATGSVCTRSTLAELQTAQSTPVVIGALITIGERAAALARDRKLAFESLRQLPEAV